MNVEPKSVVSLIIWKNYLQENILNPNLLICVPMRFYLRHPEETTGRD